MESLGIKALESVHWYVNDLERSRRFYTEAMDFQEIARSSPELEEQGRQTSLVFKADHVVLIVSSPRGEGGRAWRYLRKHPDGVGTLVFEVADIEKTFRLLDERGGTFITDIQRHVDERGGRLATFSVTTPFGDTTFRFVQRDGYRALFPRVETYAAPRGGSNRFGFTHVDHITSNFQTLKPTLLWLEHVMGFQR
ncbi:MAG TPA: VOC family protein, partial [Myxococcaceae bacterium]|nr:VOC family protein [Myxococcaceae bacterium]